MEKRRDPVIVPPEHLSVLKVISGYLIVPVGGDTIVTSDVLFGLEVGDRSSFLLERVGPQFSSTHLLYPKIEVDRRYPAVREKGTVSFSVYFVFRIYSQSQSIIL